MNIITLSALMYITNWSRWLVQVVGPGGSFPGIYWKHLWLHVSDLVHTLLTQAHYC